jgi:hypothetical protein
MRKRLEEALSGIYCIEYNVYFRMMRKLRDGCRRSQNKQRLGFRVNTSNYLYLTGFLKYAFSAKCGGRNCFCGGTLFPPAAVNQRNFNYAAAPCPPLSGRGLRLRRFLCRVRGIE